VLVVVLVRVAVRLMSVSGSIDFYLLSLCTGMLANCVPELRDLHPYTARRLLTLYELLFKRYRRAFSLAVDVNLKCHRRTTSPSKPPKSLSSSATTASPSFLCHWEICFQAALLMFHSSCFQPTALAQNPHLLYAMLQQQHLFELPRHQHTKEPLVALAFLAPFEEIHKVGGYLSDELSNSLRNMRSCAPSLESTSECMCARALSLSFFPFFVLLSSVSLSRSISLSLSLFPIFLVAILSPTESHLVGVVGSTCC
jgi:Dyggve-Melchior-Clausen syndrome protein